MPFPFPSSIAPGRCIVFIICLSLVVVLSTSSSNPGVDPLVHYDGQFIPRQVTSTSTVPSSPTTSPTTTPTTATSETSTSTTPKDTPTTGTTNTQTSATSRDDNTNSTPQPQSSPTTPPSQVTSIQSIGSNGSPTVVVVTVPGSNTNTNTSPTATPPPKDQDNGGSSGLGTGSIIGLSVAGGIALLGIAAFFIWKFTRKHRSATYDDGEIKWPDLNSENHVSGLDTAPQRDSASVRDPSFRGTYGDGGLGASQSQVDLYAADPYAVPPLPHLNPNQPYRDDPNVYNDNFGAPAFHESRPSSPSIRGEAIPMNQINRTKSPGPQGALYTGHGGRQSPAPQAGGYGRQSPGPQDAYGGGYGRRSPGPNDAYGPR